MVVPAHVGLEHPNMLWVVVVGIVAFAAGLWMNLSRGGDTTPEDAAPKPDETN